MTSERLAKLERQRAQLNARIQKEKSKESIAARKKDTQAKVLLGAGLMVLLKKNDDESKAIYQKVRGALTDKDKERLDIALGRKQAPQKPAAQTQQKTEPA